MKALKRSASIVGMMGLITLPVASFAQNWSTDEAGTDYKIINDANSSTVPFTIEGGTLQDSMFLDSTGNVGLGTSTPGGTFSARIHIADPTPDILLDDTDDTQLWYLFADFEGMGFADETGSSIPFFIESAAPFDAIRVKSDGKVGFGTDAPSEKLHVVAPSATRLLVENTDAGAVGDQTMFQLKNASGSKVRFAFTSNGDNSWTFDNDPSNDAFNISKVGTFLNEFVIQSNGDGTFRGNSYAVQHLNTSSRSLKTGFIDIDPQSLLEKLARLPVTQWRYKTEGKSAKHIGPVAEDFQEIFGLGDGNTISTVDSGGIAIASIQALYQDLREKEARILEQEITLGAQEKKLLEQEERLQRLERRIEALNSSSKDSAY